MASFTSDKSISLFIRASMNDYPMVSTAELVLLVEFDLASEAKQSTLGARHGLSSISLNNVGWHRLRPRRLRVLSFQDNIRD